VKACPGETLFTHELSHSYPFIFGIIILHQNLQILACYSYLGSSSRTNRIVIVNRAIMAHDEKAAFSGQIATINPNPNMNGATVQHAVMGTAAGRLGLHS